VRLAEIDSEIQSKYIEAYILLFLSDLTKRLATRGTLDRRALLTPATRSPHPNPNPNLDFELTFDLIFIGGRVIVMDYTCVRFSNFSFSRFDGYTVRAYKQNYRGACSLYSREYTVGMSNRDGCAANVKLQPYSTAVKSL